MINNFKVAYEEFESVWKGSNCHTSVSEQKWLSSIVSSICVISIIMKT